MDQHNREYELSSDSHEAGRATFTDKLQELLPDVRFEESAEILEARTAVLEALTKQDQNLELLRSIWVEYTKICQQTVDSKTPSNADPRIRAQFQIAALVHKALIFREIGDVQRYGRDLTDAKDYALTKHLDAIAEAIGRELGSPDSKS